MTERGFQAIVVGGGFAGVAAADALGKAGVSTLLIDRNSYHQFQPLIYQVASAQIGPNAVARPLRAILRRRRSVRVLTAAVTSLDASSASVTTEDGVVYAADFLVVASGAEANYFGTPGAEENAYPLYSVTDALSLGSELFDLFDDSDRDPSIAAEVVVVGGGPTGVETTGAIAETIKYVLPHYYSAELSARAKVHLVDMVPVVLGAFSEKSQQYARRRLESVGADLHLGVGVTEVGPDSVTLADGTVIPSRMVVWAGGLKAGPLLTNSGLPQGRGGRIDVSPDLTVPGFERVYVLGDAANITDARGDKLPQLGSVAKQAGAWAAKNIIAQIHGAPRAPFDYKDKGYMAMVGRGAAVAEIGRKRTQMQGFFAFLAWLAVHVMLLSGWTQRTRAVFAWFEDYLSHSRSNVVLGASRRRGSD